MYSIINNTLGQSVNTIIGGRSSGLAGTGSVIKDISATSNNIGALAFVEETNVAFSTEFHPKLPGSSKVSSCFSLPTKLGVTGISLFRFGDNVYNELVIGIGHSHKIGISSLGIRANYIQYHSETLSNKYAFRLDFGCLTDITPKLFVGAYILNITKSKLSSEALPTKFVVGLGIKPTTHLFIISEIEKTLTYPTTFKAGVEYKVYNKLFLRTGINMSPNAGYGGIGMVIKKFNIDYAMKFTSVLGTSYSASLSYSFTRNKKQ